MNDVITFFFSTLNQLWILVKSSWVLSIGVLISVISWIVSLVNNTERQ